VGSVSEITIPPKGQASPKASVRSDRRHGRGHSCLGPKIDPPPRPDFAGALGMLGGQLVAGHDLDVRLRVDGVPADANLGVEAAIDGNGVHLNAVAAMVGEDDHRPLAFRPRGSTLPVPPT
jgi:hypothetical protein